MKPAIIKGGDGVSDAEIVGAQVSSLLNRAAGLFKPGVKLTFIARTPGNDGADFMLTNDDLDAAISLIGRRKAAEEQIKQQRTG